MYLLFADAKNKKSRRQDQAAIDISIAPYLAGGLSFISG